MDDLVHNKGMMKEASTSIGVNIGFKEWAVVCDALADGRQKVVIRKGGIAEGRDGFQFKYPAFFLMPTGFHEQVAKTILPADTKLPELPEGIIPIAYAARVTEVKTITDWEEVLALRDLHILSEQTVRERFDYDEAPGVHVAWVEVKALPNLWELPDAPRYGGCRSWVKLPEPPVSLEKVFDDY